MIVIMIMNLKMRMTVRVNMTLTLILTLKMTERVKRTLTLKVRPAYGGPGSCREARRLLFPLRLPKGRGSLCVKKNISRYGEVSQAVPRRL